MIDCLRTRVHKQAIIVLYFEFENVLKFYNLEARPDVITVLMLLTYYTWGLITFLDGCLI